MTEERTVSCCGEAISYFLTRKNVKNVNMRIKADGTIKISAPPNVPLRFIEDFVRSRYGFIKSSIERLNSEQRQAPHETKPSDEIFDGGGIYYLGEKYTVRFLCGEDDCVYINGNELIAESCDTENTAFSARLIRDWLYNRTAELFKRLNSEVSEEFLLKYGIKPAAVKMRDMKSRWGSCHILDGTIVMNTRLIAYPEMCARYVFAHEYAHFIVPNHSADFYCVVEKIMPDYKYWSDKLKGG